MTAVPLEDAPFDIAGAWRRLRLPLVIAAILVGAAVLLAAFASNPASQPLDPRDASPQGALALSRLVSDQGVSVRVAADANGAASSGATVMVPTPAALTVTELRDISATAAVVVLVAPEQRELNALDLQVTPRSGTSGTLRPGCTLDAAVRAGDISYDGTLYAAPADVHCYPHDAGAGVVVHSTGSGSIVVVGSADGKVHALGLSDGSTHWVSQIATQITSSVTIDGRCGYVGTVDGYVVCLDLQNGDTRWSYKLGSPIVSTPIKAGASVIVGAMNGKVYSIRS